MVGGLVFLSVFCVVLLFYNMSLHFSCKIQRTIKAAHMHSYFILLFYLGALKGLAERILCDTVSLFVIRLNHPSWVSYYIVSFPNNCKASLGLPYHKKNSSWTSVNSTERPEMLSCPWQICFGEKNSFLTCENNLMTGIYFTWKQSACTDMCLIFLSVTSAINLFS